MKRLHWLLGQRDIYDPPDALGIILSCNMTVGNLAQKLQQISRFVCSYPFDHSTNVKEYFQDTWQN